MRGDVSGQNSAGESTIVYQAPDRARRSRSAGEVEIFIGHTMYHSFPAMMTGATGNLPLPEGHYWRTEIPAGGPSAADGVLAELRIVAEATDVDRTGSSTYRWESGTGRAAVSGHATVENGRVVRFSFAPEDPAWENVVVTYTIGDFDRAPAVEPPPADKVIDQPAIEPCGPDGSPKPGQVVCGGDGSAPPTSQATLPAPTKRKPSALQLRAVRGVGGDACSRPAENPPADQPALLAGRDGTCYDLGPAALSIDRAEARPEQQPDGAAVGLQLDPADTRLLRQLLEERLQKQVAMVIFGTVQSAPVVHDVTTDGAIMVSGIDPQTAADIIQSLAG